MMNEALRRLDEEEALIERAWNYAEAEGNLDWEYDVSVNGQEYKVVIDRSVVQAVYRYVPPPISSNGAYAANLGERERSSAIYEARRIASEIFDENVNSRLIEMGFPRK